MKFSPANAFQPAMALIIAGYDITPPLYKSSTSMIQVHHKQVESLKPNVKEKRLSMQEKVTMKQSDYMK